MLKTKEDKKENFSLGWKRFVVEFKNRKKDSIKIVLFSLFVFIPFSAEKYWVGKVLDSLIDGSKIYLVGITVESVYFFIMMFIISGIVWRVFDVWGYGYLGPRVANDVYKSYTKKVFSSIISYPTKFFKENAMGKITYSINTGANTLYSSFSGLAEMFGFPFLLAFNMFFLFLVSWQIGLVISFSAIVFAIFFQKTLKKRTKVSKEFNDEKKRITTFLTENINLSIEVKKNASEKKETLSLVEKMTGSFDDKFYSKLYFNLLTDIFWKLLFLITMGINLFFLTWLYKNKLITEGGFLSVILYGGSIMENINVFVRNMNRYVENFTIIGDTEKLLLHTPENYTKGKVSTEVKGEIEFKNMWFKYETEQSLSENTKEVLEKEKVSSKKSFSLNNINFKINKGQKVAFVGESGGGKSTTVELVGGFYLPTSGEVLIDNIATSKWNLHDLRSSIAYVSQDIAIFNSTIGENISYGAKENATQEQIQKAAKLAHIDEFVMNLPKGYQTSVGEKGLKLSGGQKQRIAIARAILRDPKILILDEPTSALDIVSEKYITESLKELMKGRTTIIVAHRLSTVADADKIFVFKEGRVVEQGNFTELVEQKGEFKKMVDLHEQLN